MDDKTIRLAKKVNDDNLADMFTKVVTTSIISFLVETFTYKYSHFPTKGQDPPTYFLSFQKVFP